MLFFVLFITFFYVLLTKKKNKITSSAAEETTTPKATDSPTSTDMVWTLTKITKVLACNRTELHKDFLVRLSSRFEFFARYSSFGLVFRRTVQNPGATLTDTTKAGLIHKISNSIPYKKAFQLIWIQFQFDFTLSSG